MKATELDVLADDEQLDNNNINNEDFSTLLDIEMDEYYLDKSINYHSNKI